MKNLAFLLVGVPFGIIMTKSEVISWFRIVEMFRFESIHMYGVIGVAVVVSAIAMALFKRLKVRTAAGKEVYYEPRPLRIKQHLLAGSLFGVGWAISGACPGPMWVLLGNGFAIAALFIAGALLGTFVYGLVMHKLPH
jgi:uncharacterized membrane protein YedE/YeeE